MGLYAKVVPGEGLPASGGKLPVVEMKARRSGDHPWIYRRMLRPADLPPGSLVEVCDRAGQFVGRGIYNGNSEIAVRLLTTDERVPLDRSFVAGAVARAVSLRRGRLRLDDTTNSYRLIHSEGDGLSGLVVDRYGEQIVIQLYSAGFFRMLPWVRDELGRHFPGARFHVRADHRSEKLEGVKMDGEPAGESSVEIREGPCRFLADLRKGHKTGFFLDQRDNRTFAADLARRASVLDCFCYTGGFAITCAVRGECREIRAVDLDEKALAVAKENARLNGLAEDRVEWIHGDVFDVLRELRAAKRLFDMAILDPAKMAVSREEAHRALDAYTDMNKLAMGVLRPGGILVSCSCSGAVSEPDFLLALRCAAREASCNLQVFRVAGAAPDHPFSIHCPEGRYLKAVFSRVFPSRP